MHNLPLDNKKHFGIKIFLKRLCPDDLNDDMLLWFEDEELMEYYTSSKRKIDKVSLQNSIKEGESNNNLFTYGIFDINNNLCIGTVKLGPIHFIHKTSDMATLVGNKSYHGKGFAKEAIKLAINIAFNVYGIRKLISGMYASNVASIKSYQKAGWVVEGRLKGHYFVNGKNEDRILVGCYNPDFFSESEITELRELEKQYNVL